MLRVCIKISDHLNRHLDAQLAMNCRLRHRRIIGPFRSGAFRLSTHLVVTCVQQDTAFPAEERGSSATLSDTTRRLREEAQLRDSFAEQQSATTES